VVFTSWTFASFFAIVLAGLLLLPTRTLRQVFILLASAYFYAYSQAWYLLVPAAPAFIDYWCARRIEQTSESRARRWWLVLSIITNIGLLAYFKYTNFFIANLAALAGLRPSHLDIVLPIGISFLTFKTLSYTIDVYRGHIPACHSLWHYAMFVAYFPDIVAGPIVRASVFLPQMVRSLHPSWGRTFVGAQIILLGLTKKLVIADQLAPLADAAFAAPSLFSPLTVASGVIAYSLQIYCDFSGYSDIAIGVSHIIGFDLPENFNMPYLATSLTEFWRRWHITLSQWLRDYLYIPLGGNRRGQQRTYVNLLITMVLGGLWHGAGWTFVCWGFLHGIGLIVHKLWLERTGGRLYPLGGLGGWLLTYLFVCVTWVFFRAPNLRVAVQVLRKLAGLDQGGTVWFYSPLILVMPLIVLGHIIGILATRSAHADPERLPPPAWAKATYVRAGSHFVTRTHEAAGLYVLLPMPGFVGAFVLVAWILVVLVFSALDTNPFIYFQF